MRVIFKYCIILFGAILPLSACVTTIPETPPENASSPFPQAVPTPDVEEEVIEVDPIEATQVEGQSLLGLEPEATERLFGIASFVRWEGNAIIRQYKSSTCILDIVFYEELSGAPFKSTHFESRSQTGESIEINNCIEGFFEKGKVPSLLLKEG